MSVLKIYRDLSVYIKQNDPLKIERKKKELVPSSEAAARNLFYHCCLLISPAQHLRQYRSVQRAKTYQLDCSPSNEHTQSLQRLSAVHSVSLSKKDLQLEVAAIQTPVQATGAGAGLVLTSSGLPCCPPFSGTGLLCSPDQWSHSQALLTQLPFGLWRFADIKNSSPA